MADIKLTKNDLRAQQGKLGQLEKYLPTLQLKKALLQAEVANVKQEIAQLKQEYQKKQERAKELSLLLSDQPSIDFDTAVEVDQVKKRIENIAGVEVPFFEEITFHQIDYLFFDTPPWTERVIKEMRRAVEAREKVQVGEEKKQALEKELRDVSIRVNLFEKILIPRALANIKKIKVFLGDQELSAVSQAKVAKVKIEERKHAY